MIERELRLIRSLRRSLENIEEQIRAIRDSQERQKGQRDIQPLWINPILTERKQAETNNSTHQEKNYRVQKSLRTATWCAFAAAAIYAAIAYRQKLTMDSQLTAMNNTFAEIQKQTKGVQESAHAAKKGVELAQKSLEIDERAWISMLPTKGATLNINQGIFASFAILNYGKTPALHVNGFFFVHLLPRNRIPDFSLVPNPNPPPGPNHYWHGQILIHEFFPNTDPTKSETGIATIDPDVKQPKDTTHFAPVIATPELIRDLTNPETTGKHWIAVYGRVSYDDIFLKHHWITFCWDALKTNFAIPSVVTACGDRNQQGDTQ